MRRTAVAALVAALLAACSSSPAPVDEPVPTVPASTSLPSPTNPPSTQPSTSMAPSVPEARRGHGMAATGKGLLLFGGWTVRNGSRVFLGDTWLFDPATAEWDPLPKGPAVRSQAAIAGGGGTVLAFGGYVGSRFTYRDAWLWREATDTWRKVEAAGPSGRAGTAVAYDQESSVFVLFGGAERPTETEESLSETWVFDPVAERWTRIDAEGPVMRPEGYPVRFELAMAYDVESDRVILLMGAHDVWAFDTNAGVWERRSAPPGFDADYMVAAAYHAGLDRVVMYGGAPTTRTQQTWLYDENTDSWERRITARDPGPIGDHAMTYDPATDGVYLFGGGSELLVSGGSGDFSAELWRFDGVDWALVAP